MDPAEGHTGLTQEMDEIDSDACNCNYYKEFDSKLKEDVDFWCVE